VWVKTSRLESCRAPDSGHSKSTPCDESMLSPDDQDVLEDIRAAWVLRRNNCPPHQEELVDIALRRMQQDLHSCRREEVVEDVQREIAYRLWCTQEDRIEENVVRQTSQPVSPILDSQIDL
jgi:hypothetical protein